MSRRLRLFALFLLLHSTLFASDQKPASKEGWVSVDTRHFSVVTDAGEKKGREVALRLEQMRAVFGNLLMRDKLKTIVPVQVLALKSDKDYEKLAPVRGAVVTNAPGFFLAGEDRDFIVLNLFDEEPWRAIAHPFAHMLLDGNYPLTHAWFDEGFAEYFSSIRLDNKTLEIGSDPELSAKYSEDLIGNVSEVRHPPKSLTELLSAPVWLSLRDFLTMHPIPGQEGTHHTLFYAQSWIVMHYILSKKLLPQAGAYFGLVQNEKVPPEQALQQAFGMNAEQFEKAVREYFQSLTPLFQAQDKMDRPGNEGDLRNVGPELFRSPAPLGPDDVAMVVKKLIDDDAHAIVDSVMIRQPERQPQGIRDLQALADEPADNGIAQRELGFAYIQKKDFKRAAEQLESALDGRPNDPWVRYYLALLRIRNEQASGRPMEGGLANVQQNLRIMTDSYPEFAEAYHLLGLAELEGGGINAALDNMRLAIQLNPRNQVYVMHLADIYLAGKKWDNGQAILDRLKDSSDPQIASAAKKKLEDLPFVKKYGITPDRAPDAQNPKPIEANSGISNPLPDDDADTTPKLKERTADKRPVVFAKGKIVSVDCSHSPAAVVTLSSAGRVLKLRAEDYKSLVVVGADQFSCNWKNLAASANYKASGKGTGDLVSLEVE
ncbi:MAG TPA: hypothetical protein VGF08_00010 [Terriglobales bacterium]|jgi:tetratricopeptide (TPR) repeat protein